MHSITLARPTQGKTRTAASPAASPCELQLLGPQLLRVERGSLLHVQSGTVLLLQQDLQLLADRVWQAPAQNLGAGAVWLAQTSGWIQLRPGQTGTSLLLRQASELSWWQRLTDWLCTV